jgi:hypothetical protein
MKYLIVLLALVSCTEHICTEPFKEPNITLEYLDESTLSERNTYTYWKDKTDETSKEIYYWSEVMCTDSVYIDLSIVLDLKSEYVGSFDKAMPMYEQFIYRYYDGYILCDSPDESIKIKLVYDSLRLDHALFKQRMLTTTIVIDGLIADRDYEM